MGSTTNNPCYTDARRLGTKEYSRNMSRGQTGYLPFLEGLLKNSEILSEVDLGVVDVPLKKFIGTYTYTRSISFASNFMPLMSENTEFASKWKALASAHINEGIREPVKAYEYLNWFYVVEGNKRVSVLKYFDAFSFRANVTRLIPKRDENDLSSRIYYEFLDFYKKTKINNIWFSKENSFKELLGYIEGSKVDEKFSKEKIEFSAGSSYLLFRKAYLEAGGGNLPITTGDAFLDYIKVFGYHENFYGEDFYRNVKKFISELEYFKNPNTVNVETGPANIEENAVVSKISTLLKSKKKLKVGFAYARTAKDSNWTYTHEMGRTHLESVLKGQISTMFVDNIPENSDAYKYLKHLADKGCEVIFATSPFFINAALKAALEYPNVKFLNCSYDHSFKHVNTYFGRIHEPRFLSGIIAGVMTQTNRIGYIGTYPIPEVVSGINSFTLGVRSVNPRAVVKVLWTYEWDCREKSREISAELARNGADIISHHNSLADKRVEDEFGLYSMVCSKDTNECIKGDIIAAPVWNWGMFYERIIRSVFNGLWAPVADLFGSAAKPVNFWWGMDSEILDFFYSKSLVPKETQKMIEFIKRMISNNSFNPFTGPIYNQNAELMINEGEFASREQILSMDWFVEGVESDLPEASNRDEIANLFTGRI